MNVLINLAGVFLAIILGPVFVVFAKTIHKREKWVYMLTLSLSLLFSLLTLLLSPMHQLFEKSLSYQLIFQGHLSLSLVLIIMYTSVFKHQSLIKKKLSMVRKELAIVMIFMLLPHFFHRIDLALSGYNFTGLIAFLLMLPLFFTSFKMIRRHIKPKSWFKIHRMAYVAYFLIYIHLAVVLWVSSTLFIFNTSYYFWVYTVIFLVYAILRMYRLYERKRT